jgi:hypothetical protein
MTVIYSTTIVYYYSSYTSDKIDSTLHQKTVVLCDLLLPLVPRCATARNLSKAPCPQRKTA